LRVAKRLSYIEDAQCQKVNSEQYLASGPVLHHSADTHRVTLLDLGWGPTGVRQQDDATVI